MRSRSLLLSLIALALVPASAAADSTTRILVQRDAGLSAAERADIRSDAGVRFVESLGPPRTEVVSAPDARADAALAGLERDPDVRRAMLVPELRTFAPPDDDFFDLQWALQNSDPDFSYADLDGVEAWDLATGAGETVAVVDSGVETSHNDLQANMAPGWDFVENDPTPQDPDGHGTHVAGIIAAVTGNSRGVAGLARGAEVMPLRALPEDEDDDNTFFYVLDAFDYAGQQGVPIVNASLGSPPITDPGDFAFLEQFFNDVFSTYPDTLFVFAAGNDANDNDRYPVLPCSASAANVVCVGSTNDHDLISDFSNYGHRLVDLFAPGEEIFSTVPGGYTYMSGTSMASPQVAAIAALVREAQPGITTAALKQAILGSADQIGASQLESVTDARANAHKALLWFDVPDLDGDSVANATDNCWQDANGSQQNLDGDLRGDVCDFDDDGDRVADAADKCPVVKGSTSYAGCAPPPPVITDPGTIPTPTPPADGDRDGVYDVSDACRGIPATTKDGCPLPQLSSLSAKRKGKTVTVRVRTTRDAAVRITVQRKKGKRWVRVARKSKTTSNGRASLKVKRLKRGRYRVVVSVRNSSGSGTTRSKSFRVR